VISRIRGTVLTQDLKHLEVETASGLVYEVEVPSTALDRLPRVGQPVELRTHYVVREESATLFGFVEPHERDMFKRLLLAPGVGPKLALTMLSTYPARRLARALVEKDIVTLSQINGIGKKTAEKICLALADRVEDLAIGPVGEPSTVPGTSEAVQALMTLGYTVVEADQAVRAAVEGGAGEGGVEEVVRSALAARGRGRAT